MRRFCSAVLQSEQSLRGEADLLDGKQQALLSTVNQPCFILNDSDFPLSATCHSASPVLFVRNCYLCATQVWTHRQTNDLPPTAVSYPSDSDSHDDAAETGQTS